MRAGYSYDVTDIADTASQRDAADDNLNAFDPYPPGHTGELNDQDDYDAAGALDSACRPDAAVRDAGRHQRHRVGGDPGRTAKAAGADPLGRVNFFSYYRPPGSPGSVASYPAATATPPATLGAIYYPSNATGNNFFYTNGPNNNPAPPAPASALAYPTFLPDVTNNPLHAFEFFRLPPIVTEGTTTGHTISGAFKFQFQFQQNRNPAMPLDQTVDSHGFPDLVPDL